MLERVWRKGNPLALLVGMSIDTATMENSMEVPLKTKNKQMGPNETSKLLHSKGNHKQDEKTTLRMGENIANESMDKGLISKIYK